MAEREHKEPGFPGRIFLLLKSKRFYMHVIAAGLVGVLILWMALRALGSYTHHGEAIPVPDFSGVKIDDLDRFVADKHLRYQVVDSVFDPHMKSGTVVRQDPEKNSAVKENRTVYLTVSAKNAPLVKMPNLVDASLRQATALLESYGLKAGGRSYRPDPCVNCVLEQRIKGRKVEAGKMVPKGSVVDLVLGQGQEGDKIKVVCLSGLTHSEAGTRIAEGGFSEGAVVCTDCKTSADKEKAKVYKQNPSCSSEPVKPGTAIDLFLSVKQAPAGDE